MVSLTHSTQTLGILNILLRAGFISSITRGTISGPSPEQFTTAKESEKRIWATLKYRNDQPVLSDMEVISKPSRRVFMELADLRAICSGRTSKQVKPLGMGEVAMVRTKDKEHEWLEAREALTLKIPGEAVCRAR
jgi:ribosomal protein S8